MRSEVVKNKLGGIEAIFGVIGGGKSYTATERMLEEACMGSVIRTNVPLNIDEFREECRRRGWELGNDQVGILTDADTQDFHKHVPQGEIGRLTFVVIDEAHRHWPARKTVVSGVSDELMEFLTHVRHYHVRVIMISQSMENVDCRVRRLIEYWWKCRDMRRWRFIGMKYRLPQLLQVQFDMDGKTEIGSRLIAWDPRIWRCYHSFEGLTDVTMESAQGEFGGRLTKDEIMTKWNWVGVSCLICVGITINCIVTKHAVAKGVQGAGSTTTVVKKKQHKFKTTIPRLETQFYSMGLNEQGEVKQVFTARGVYVFGAISRDGEVLSIRPGIIAIRGFDGIERFIVDVPLANVEESTKT